MKILTCFFTVSILFCIQCYASIEKHTLSSDDFIISEPLKNWNPVEIENKKEIILALQPKSKSSSFTLREFKNPDPSLKKNVVAWMRDYKSYGFKIISSKPVKLNDKTYGYFIQALHKKSKKVFRQYMSIKNKKLAVLTCHSDKLSSEFKECSESLSSFSWINRTDTNL